MDLQEFYLTQSSNDFLVLTLNTCNNIKNQTRFINKALRENTVFIQFIYMSTVKISGVEIVKFALKTRKYTFVYEYNMATKELKQKGAKEIVKVSVT